MNNPSYRYWVLVSIVFVGGFSQGMLLPIIAILLENIGISSSANGINAAALYIGYIVIFPFIEQFLRKFGYKPIITFGLFLFIITLMLFPIWQTFWFWFILRLIIGIANNLIHMSTQIWVSSTSSPEKRGRQLTIYGFSFGLGFGIGPMMTRLMEVNLSLPFIIASCCSLITLGMLFLLRNEYPSIEATESAYQFSTLERYKKTLKLSWFALLPGFTYGFLDASLQSNFPVYALRIGIEIEFVTMILLPSFIFGGLITQFPLGYLSDKIGRIRVLIFVLTMGFFAFFCMGFVEHLSWAMWILFSLAGTMLGSLYSLGIAYLADLLPMNLLPTGNILIGGLFALGSMSGPIVGGILMDMIGQGAIYYSFCFLLLLMVISGCIFEKTRDHHVEEKHYYSGT